MFLKSIVVLVVVVDLTKKKRRTGLLFFLFTSRRGGLVKDYCCHWGSLAGALRSFDFFLSA